MQEAPDDFDKAVALGTTIVAARYNGGVILAADSRTTTGALIANRVTDKITRISDQIYCLRSGSAADTQAVADYVKMFLQEHALELGSEPQVRTAAHLLRMITYSNKDRLSAGLICAGWDKDHGGQVFTIPLGGTILEVPFAIGGSGSTYIYGFVDANFKENMTKEECVAFISAAVKHAMHRDGSSGGIMRMAIITESGVERLVRQPDPVPRY